MTVNIGYASMAHLSEGRVSLTTLYYCIRRPCSLPPPGLQCSTTLPSSIAMMFQIRCGRRLLPLRRRRPPIPRRHRQRHRQCPALLLERLFTCQKRSKIVISASPRQRTDFCDLRAPPIFLSALRFMRFHFTDGNPSVRRMEVCWVSDWKKAALRKTCTVVLVVLYAHKRKSVAARKPCSNLYPYVLRDRIKGH
jgi:hypothetical protein